MRGEPGARGEVCNVQTRNVKPGYSNPSSFGFTPPSPGLPCDGATPFLGEPSPCCLDGTVHDHVCQTSNSSPKRGEPTRSPDPVSLCPSPDPLGFSTPRPYLPAVQGHPSTTPLGFSFPNPNLRETPLNRYREQVPVGGSMPGCPNPRLGFSPLFPPDSPLGLGPGTRATRSKPEVL